MVTDSLRDGVVNILALTVVLTKHLLTVLDTSVILGSWKQCSATVSTQVCFRIGTTGATRSWGSASRLVFSAGSSALIVVIPLEQWVLVTFWHFRVYSSF